MYTVVFTADMHFRDSKPKCRTDDFYNTQMDMFHQVMEIVGKYDAIWVDAGDFFHQARPSYKLMSDILVELTKYQMHIYTLQGNHDMPWHNIGKIKDSGIGVLESAGVVSFLGTTPLKYGPFSIYGCPYEGTVPEPSIRNITNVLVYHGMVWKNRRDAIPGVEGLTARQALSMFRHHLVVSGHNHQSFCAETTNGVLCNVGCLTRQSADLKEHQPRVLVVKESKQGFDYDWEYLKYDKDAVTTEHLEVAAKREEELNAFVEGLKNMEEASLSFKDNVDRVVRQAKPEKEVVDKIKEAVYGN